MVLQERNMKMMKIKIKKMIFTFCYTCSVKIILEEYITNYFIHIINVICIIIIFDVCHTLCN